MMDILQNGTRLTSGSRALATAIAAAFGLAVLTGPAALADPRFATQTDFDSHVNDPNAHGGDDDTLGDLSAVCEDGDFAQLDPDGSGEWQCLSLTDLKLALGLTKFAFLTSLRVSGDLVSEAKDISNFDPPYDGNDGLGAGDFICTALANAVGVPQSFTAWLSTSEVDAVDRLTESIYVRPDGFLVATSLTDLTDGSLITSISVEETAFGDEGPIPGTFTSVRTGTLSDGTISIPPDTCMDWTSADPGDLGVTGRATDIGPGWTDSIDGQLDDPCDSRVPLYCFER